MVTMDRELEPEVVTIARAAVADCRADERCRRRAESLAIDASVMAERRVHLVGAGKAVSAMARGAIDGLRSRFGPSPVREGLAVTKDDHAAGFAAEAVELLFASHPMPDQRSAAAGAALRRRLSFVPREDHVVALVSGGASSLIATPVDGLDVAALRRATDVMLGSGVGIEAMNGVRKHLTSASGGRLAELCAAPIDVLVVSDVLSDDLGSIGSGPFAPDPTTYEQALEVVSSLADFPAPARLVLEEGARGERPETPAGDHPCFSRVRHHVVASHASLIEAACARAEKAGYRVTQLPPFEGDVSDAAVRLLEASAKLSVGEVVVTGGEPTVVLPEPHGRGGRNQHLALLVAGGLAGGPPRRFVALGSDGTDGPTDAAGAWVDDQTLRRLSATGDPDEAVDRADAYPLLQRHGHLVTTGATGTNVLDLHLLIAPRSD